MNKNKIKSGLCRLRAFFSARPLAFVMLVSLVLYLFIEMLGRRSVTAAFIYLVTDPAVFLSNWLIVAGSLCFALFFHKRDFYLVLIALIWGGLGLTNFILLGHRTTPLNFMDFRTFKDVMTITTVYFSTWQIALMIAGLLLVVAGLVVLYLKTASVRLQFKRTLCTVTSVCALVGLVTGFSVSSGILATTFHNIQDAYKDYGFAYCFAASVVGRGIDEPAYYSESYINRIVSEIPGSGQTGDGGNADGSNTSGQIYGDGITASDKATEKTPNVIFLQLESFFDVNHLKDVTFSENPVPNFTSLKENYSSGILTTPSFGAGTANTEFEVLTGMSVEYFGPGEYPYTTILRETADESAAVDLKPWGYSSRAIHDHTGKFYGRYLVYPELGFDSFTSVEYMQDLDRNPLNWADDSCLTSEILKSMNSTENQDFVFAVSVQGHGKYPEECIDDSQTITVNGFHEDEAVGFEYYVNQIHDMDAFIGELTQALEACGEPTVLVLYGDHLPKFSFSPEELDNGSLYETEYVIWNNFGMTVEDKDLHTYQLYPEVMNRLDMHNGVINAFQQYCADDDFFSSKLKALQYDILYGNCYCYGGSNPFTKSDMEMGIDEITIDNVSAVGSYVYVTGENFTSASTIYINGSEADTVFLNSGRLRCDYPDISDGDTFDVIQLSSRKTKLSSAGLLRWHPDGCQRLRDGIRNLSLEDIESDESIIDDINREEQEL